MANEMRFNYSRVEGNSNAFLDSFGGAVALTAQPLPSPFTAANGQFTYQVFSLSGGGLVIGRGSRNLQRQINIVNNFSLQKGSHSLKFGIDFRRLSPEFDPPTYTQEADFLDVGSAAAGNLGGGSVGNSRAATFLFRNLGAYAQDTWRIGSQLTLTYGLRWDVDFAPSAISGPSLSAATGFNLKDLSQLALAPPGAPPFTTPYRSVAPRLGIAWQLSQSPRWQRVLRGGMGVFYDLATSEVGNILFTGVYPYKAQNFSVGSTFPFDSATAAPPPASRTGWRPTSCCASR